MNKEEIIKRKTFKVLTEIKNGIIPKEILQNLYRITNDELRKYKKEWSALTEGLF